MPGRRMSRPAPSRLKKLLRGALGYRAFRLGCLLILPALAAWRLGLNLWVALLYCLLMSLFMYGLYWHDKTRAQAQGWRVPETTLHAFALVGGWPGAYVAQRHLRHKTSKKGFQLVFWVIVLAWQVLSLVLLL